MEFIHHKPVMKTRILPNGEFWVTYRRKVTYIGADVLGTWVHTTTEHTCLQPDGTLVAMEGETYQDRVEREGVHTSSCQQVSTRVEARRHPDGGVTALVHCAESGIYSVDDGMLCQTVVYFQNGVYLDVQPGPQMPTRMTLTESSRATTHAELSPQYCPLLPIARDPFLDAYCPAF